MVAVSLLTILPGTGRMTQSKYDAAVTHILFWLSYLLFEIISLLISKRPLLIPPGAVYLLNWYISGCGLGWERWFSGDGDEVGACTTVKPRFYVYVPH